jgi:hypothetical protein
MDREDDAHPVALVPAGRHELRIVPQYALLRNASSEIRVASGRCGGA